MRFKALPVRVDAFEITHVTAVKTGDVEKTTIEIEVAPKLRHYVTLDAGMTARHTPAEGDYFVVQEDGYAYINPRSVFERKYEPIEDAKPAEMLKTFSKAEQLQAELNTRNLLPYADRPAILPFSHGRSA